MKFYRRRTGRKLFSFGDDIRQLPICWKPLQQAQAEIIHECGFDLQDVREESEIGDSSYFLFEDDLVFSKGFIEGIVAIAKQQKKSLRFCLAENSYNERFSLPTADNPKGKAAFAFYYKQKDSPAAVDTVVPQKVYHNRAAIPRQVIRQGYYSYDQCQVFLAALISPFHLLQANLAFLFLEFSGLRARLPERLVQKWFAPHSRLLSYALRFRNRIGKNCRIHPTAVIEGCEIGDDVTIGAHSVLRLAKVGAGTTLEEHVVLKYSVLGRNNYISNGNQINGCMTYDDVFLIHGPYQVSIFGEQATVMAVINCDIRLDQKNIMIETAHGLLDSKQSLFGIAYGHRAKIGGGNIIAPGRIVPNNYQLPPPELMKMSFKEAYASTVSQ